MGLSADELADIYTLHLLTIKPTVYIANVDESGFENNPYLDKVTEIAAAEGSQVVAVCNKLESEIAELEAEEKLEFLQEMGMTEPGLDRVIRAGYTCSACRPISPPAQRKYAPGPSKKAPPPQSSCGYPYRF